MNDLYFTGKSKKGSEIKSLSQKVYIIRHEVAEYHQHVVLYLIKPQEKYTLKRDDIQPEGLMICAALRASMIYQTCGLDKKSRIKMIRLFWCG